MTPADTASERRVRALFRAGAVSNALVTVPAFVAYRRYVAAFTDEEPNYPFLVWIWSGMAFLWGLMFWDISRDPQGRQAMIKYAYAEKAITSTSVVVAYRRGNVPKRFVASILLTDVVWIPAFVWAHPAIRRLQQ